MRKRLTRRIVLIVILAILLGIVTTGVALYVQACRLPADYMPAILSHQQRKQQVETFAGQLLDFHRNAQHRQPYTLAFSQQRMNDYLASLDEIASGLPGSTMTEGQVNQAMADADVADPAVAFKRNVVTLMIRSTRRNKVFSVDVGLSFTVAGKLQVRLLAARVGRLSMPKDLITQVLSQLKYEARTWLEERDPSEATPAEDGVLSPGDIGGAMAAVVAAIDEEPIDTTATIDGKRIRIVDVQITPGGDMTLHVKPLGRPVSEDVAQQNRDARRTLPEELRNR